jgi:hypothetical protein
MVRPFRSKWDHNMSILALWALSIINILMIMGDNNNSNNSNNNNNNPTTNMTNQPYSNVQPYLIAITFIVISILLLYMLRAKWSRLKQLHTRWSQQIQASNNHHNNSDEHNNNVNELNCFKKILWHLLGWIIVCVTIITVALQTRVEKVSNRLKSYSGSNNHPSQRSQQEPQEQPKDHHHQQHELKNPIVTSSLSVPQFTEQSVDDHENDNVYHLMDNNTE